MSSNLILFSWDCPLCGGETDVTIEAESPSDYIADTICDWCLKKIDDAKLDAKIMSIVTDHFVVMAEMQRDAQQNR